MAKRPSSASVTVHSAPVGRPGISTGAPSANVSAPELKVPPAKFPVHSTVTVNVSASSSGVTALPVTSLLRVSVAESSVFSKASAVPSTAVVNSIASSPAGVPPVRPVSVQLPGLISVTVHSEPGGTSGRSARAAAPLPAVVVIAIVVFATSTPSLVQTIAKPKVPSTSPARSLAIVNFSSEKLEVVFMISTVSPSLSIVTVVGDPVEVNRGSACSVTVHSAPVGRSSICSGVFAVIVCPAIK